MPKPESLFSPQNKVRSQDPSPVKEDEQGLLDSLGKDEEKRRRERALTDDIKVNTRLKIGLSCFICLLIAAWCWALYDITTDYIQSMYGLRNMYGLRKEIPKEVILAALASGATVTGLMGFILKGLFRSP